MNSRGLPLAWFAGILVFVVLLGYELVHWRALAGEGQRAAEERRRLADEVRLREEQLAAVMRSHATLLEDMQWSATTSGDPSAFLTRLAELASEKRLKITAVGPLERQSTPQFTKSWRAVQVVGPYREIRELAARVEREKGILEDLRLEPAPAAAGRVEGAGAVDEVQARFRMTALDLSAQAKKILDGALAAGGKATRNPSPPVLPGTNPPAQGSPPIRDPFAFGSGKLTVGRAGPPAAPGPPATPPAPRPAAPPVVLELSAIVSLSGGYLAIINNQIVKVGDVVSGARVEQISETAVTLREPGEAPRVIELPELGAEPPAAPRR